MPLRRAQSVRLIVLASLATASGAATGQMVPLARLALDGSYDALEVGAAGTQPTLVASGLKFLPVELAGAPKRDRLRLDVPRPSNPKDPVQHIVLPQGGALYRVSLAAGQALLHANGDGQLAVLATSPALAERLAVSADSAFVLVATPAAAGGDVVRLDLSSPDDGSTNLTVELPPLDVSDESLRVSAAGAFWVANGVLWRAPAGSGPAAVDLGLPGLPALPDLLLSANGQRVAVVAGSQDIETADRRIAVVDMGGTVTVVTPEAGDWDTASHDSPLGPFLALNEDGSRLVYRGTVVTQELFLAEVDLPVVPQPISVEPQFPAYIDNVGVLGFTPDGSLTFFAGDVTISGVDQQEMIGAADLYIAQLPVGAPPTFINQSLTSGQLTPPYDQPGQLLFSEALLDPLAHRYLLVGESPAEDQTVTSVSLLGDGYSQPVLTLLDGLDSDPLLVAAGQGVLLVSEIESDEGVSFEEIQRLDLLPSLHAQPDGALVPLGLLPEPLLADRFCASPTGGWLGLAVSIEPGLELPVLLHANTGALLLPVTTPFGLPERLAFDSLGRVVVGLGYANGPYTFVAFDPESSTYQWLGVKVGTGFPLGP